MEPGAGEITRVDVDIERRQIGVIVLLAPWVAKGQIAEPKDWHHAGHGGLGGNPAIHDQLQLPVIKQEIDCMGIAVVDLDAVRHQSQAGGGAGGQGKLNLTLAVDRGNKVRVAAEHLAKAADHVSLHRQRNVKVVGPAHRVKIGCPHRQRRAVFAKVDRVAAGRRLEHTGRVRRDSIHPVAIGMECALGIQPDHL